MARQTVGVLARLASYLNTWAAPDRSRSPQRRREPDRHQLAVQLLGTLSPAVLADTGHRKSSKPASLRSVRRVRNDDFIFKHPPPVGDLSRPRS